MSSWNRQLCVGFILLGLSAVIYYIQVLMFDNLHDTIFYLLQELAFMPVQILLVTLLLNQLLSMREKRLMLKKMNMVIGVFFSEVGIDMVKCCAKFDQHECRLNKKLLLDDSWTESNFRIAHQVIKEHVYSIDSQKGDLVKLRIYLMQKRQFLLGLLANPNLLEHDSFTELLWAVFHLVDELSHREDVSGLPIEDYEHLALDIERVYSLLIYEWLCYMKHLKTDYPYLFSLAIRTNPFNEHASIAIKG